MTYQPTLADLPQEIGNGAGYKPMLSDLSPESLNAHEQSNFLMQMLAQVLPHLAQPGGTFYGGPGQDILAGLAKSGQGIANAPYNIVNSVSPQLASHIPQSPLNNTNVEQLLGANNQGVGDKLIEGAAQFAPYTELPIGLAGQGAAFGATQSNNPLIGAAVGAATGYLPIKGIQLGMKAAPYFQPQKLTDQIIGQLSGGKSLEENGKDLAANISNVFTNKKNYGSENFFKPVLDQVGDQSIYSNLKKLPSGIGDYRSEFGSYENIPEGIKSTFDGDIKKLDNAFDKNPTFSNAHDLQQQLGNEIGALQYAKRTRGLDSVQDAKLSSYAMARNALKGDMSGFLESSDPNLSNLWKQGTDYWRNEISPYYSDSNLRAMATGEETNPANSAIASIFKNPEPEMEKVVSDLGEKGNNSILYSFLGKTSATKSPENLVNAFKQLDEKGLGSYVPDSLSKLIESLGTRIKFRNAAQMAGGAGIGLMAAHPLAGMIPASMLEPAALAGGAMLGRSIGRGLQKIMPNTDSDLSEALLKALSNTKGAR